MMKEASLLSRLNGGFFPILAAGAVTHTIILLTGCIFNVCDSHTLLQKICDICSRGMTSCTW